MRNHQHATPDALRLYLRSIAPFRSLRPDEEISLARRARNGDADAREKLVCANLRFVVIIANRYQNRGVPLLDLINEGNAGLLRAVDRFDETKGVRFMSYATWWIRQAIIESVATGSYVFRLPLRRAARNQKIGRRVEALGQILGRRPTMSELARETGLTAADLAKAMEFDKPVLSLEAPLEEGESGSLEDVVADERTSPPDEILVFETRAQHVRAALATLEPREAAILRAYCGFDDREAQTLEQIGAEHGITRERVRQIKDRALQKLRHGRQRRELASWAVA